MGAETVKEARCDEVISDTIITERRIEARAKEGGRFSFKIMNLGPGTAKIWIDSDNREAISSYLWDAMGGPLSEFLGRTKGEDQYFLNKFYTKTVVDVGESIRETKGSVIRDKGFSLLGEKDRGRSSPKYPASRTEIGGAGTNCSGRSWMPFPRNSASTWKTSASSWITRRPRRRRSGSF